MRTTLNIEQAKGLANFFFDLAKGVVLSGVSSIIISPGMRPMISFSTVLLVIACLKIALSLLEEVE